MDIVYAHSFGMHSDRAHPKFLKGSGGACPQCIEMHAEFTSNH